MTRMVGDLIGRGPVRFAGYAVVAGVALAPGAARALEMGCAGGPCPVNPAVLLTLGIVALSLVSYGIISLSRRLANSARDAVLRDLAESKGFAALTHLDGRVIGTTAELAPPDGPLPLIGPLLGARLAISEATIYHMARRATENGISLERVRCLSDGAPRMLSVTRAPARLLFWRVLAEGEIYATPHRAGITRYDAAPFGYVNVSPGGEVATNAAFDTLFGPQAIEPLSATPDRRGVSGDRIFLPGTDGTPVATVMFRITEETEVGRASDIFLFPAGDAANLHIGASEILSFIPISLLQLDPSGGVLWSNRQAEAMLGSRCKAGADLGDLVQPLGRNLQTILNDVGRHPARPKAEMVRLRQTDFETFVQISMLRVDIGETECLLAVLADASELRMLEDKFAQSQKMEAVGKLAGGVAHDFNNVLTAISGNCDLLLLGKEADHPDHSDLIQIRQNANRAAVLVRQLLAFSRKQTLQTQHLSVQDVVTDTSYLLNRLIGEKITLALSHGRDLGWVRADHHQLEQALMNLVVNARDAMPEGGTVTIETANRTYREEVERPGAVISPGAYVEISVTDTGSGIDPKVIDKVFDPFFTTKPVGEGTGLGLSTVYGIVKQSGGYIVVENVADGGARFTILLPRAEPDVTHNTQTLSVEPVEKPDLTGAASVMLVEDEAPVRAFASRALKLRGYEVLEAESAEDAMVMLADSGNHVDVLVSDVMMPGMDGPTFAAKARKMRPELRVVFISGYAEDNFRRNLTDHDFLFLPKPFSLNDLTATVKEAVSGSA